MSATTPRGIVYPTPGDTVTSYPATAQAAAVTIDTWLSRMMSGVTVVHTSGNAAQTEDTHVTFPAGRFTVTPVVVLQAYGTSLWIAGLSDLTKDGMNLYAHTKNGNPSSTAGLAIAWQAMPGQTVLFARDQLEDQGEDEGEDEAAAG